MDEKRRKWTEVSNKYMMDESANNELLLDRFRMCKSTWQLQGTFVFIIFYL